MKIATVATGGIGGFLAVRLASSGHQVATIARGVHLEAIRQNGLVLEGFDGRRVVNPWIATDDPAEVGDVDAIIFGVKADGLEKAAQLCLPMIGSETLVVPFLNGVEAADRLAAVLPNENVGDGTAKISTTISAPGVITQTGQFNSFVFAERDSRPSQRVDALRAAINEAGSSAPETDDIERDVWAKFLLFSAVSGVTTAARCTMSDIVENDHLSRLFQDIVAETANLGRARGVALPDTAEGDTWTFAKGLPPDMRASTAIDLENGRALEIEYISGAVSRLSEQAGVDAPINRAIHAVLSPYRYGRM